MKTKNVNEVIAELIQNSPPEPEPQLSLAEQMVADYQAQLEAIAAEEAAAKAADENAPPKIANVYVWYMNSNRFTLVKAMLVNLLWIPEQLICLK